MSQRKPIACLPFIIRVNREIALSGLFQDTNVNSLCFCFERIALSSRWYKVLGRGGITHGGIFSVNVLFGGPFKRATLKLDDFTESRILCVKQV